MTSSLNQLVSSQAHKLLDESVQKQQFTFFAAGMFVDELAAFLRTIELIDLPRIEAVEEDCDALDTTDAVVVPKKVRRGHGRAPQPVLTPAGLFLSADLAARHYNISPTTVRHRIWDRVDGWRYVNEPESITGRKIRTPMGNFHSVIDAARKHGISHDAMTWRLKTRKGYDYMT